MDYDSDDSVNDLERLADKGAEYGDISAEEDEAIEDNSHNHEEGKDGGPPPAPKPEKIKRPILNPQPKLNFDSIQSSKGLLALNELFKDHKFRGSGYEKEDLGHVLQKLEQWAFRLYPKFHFEDSLKRFEALGKKRQVQVYLRKIRSGMLDNDVVRQLDDDDDDVDIPDPEPVNLPPALDSFDELLSQQIASTQSAPKPSLTDEQLARMERNRKLAMERKLQKLATQQNDPSAEMDTQLSQSCDDTTQPANDSVIDDPIESQGTSLGCNDHDVSLSHSIISNNCDAPMET